MRHALLTDVVAAVYATSKGIYGARRVRTELTPGRGLIEGKAQVAMLMHRAGLKGAAGRPKWTRIKPDTIAKDLVKRDFARNGPNQLWVTDITG